MTPTLHGGADRAGDGHTGPDGSPLGMRVLTLHQPWGWAVMHGGKTVENRTWGTTPGTIAVHAGLRFDYRALDFYPLREAWALYKSQADSPDLVGDLRPSNPILRAGVILGTVDIVDVHLCDGRRGCYRKADVLGWVPFDGSDASDPGWEPRGCSKWGDVPDRHPVHGNSVLRHMVLENPRPLVHPLPFVGQQGIRALPAEVEATVRVRLESQHARNL